MKLLIALFTLLYTTHVCAKYPVASFSSPRDTMNYFLKTMKGYKQGDEDALNLAVQALNASKLDPATRAESVRLAAFRIINTLDRLEYIDVETIPDDKTGDTWVYKRQSVQIDNKNYEVEISIGLHDKHWKFTPKTINTIYYFEQSLKANKVVSGVTQLENWQTKIKASMPEWTGRKSFFLLNGQWIAIFAILLISLILEKIVRFIFGSYLTHWLVKRGITFLEEQERRFTFPIGVMTYAAFWTMAVRLLEFQDKTLAVFLRGGYIVFTFACVLMVYRLVDVLGVWLTDRAEDTESKYDDILAPLISKTLKFVVFCLGIIFVGNSLTLDMKSIIAGMGIGGLAFAFAAKDTIANLFGSLTVLLDKPFQIGDLINIGGNIEGVVEQVGIRSTRVRTLYDSMITVPNGSLTSSYIDNYGRRNYRRWKTTLGVQYDTTPDKLNEFCEGVRDIFRKNEFIRQDNFRVYFTGFSESSLEILINLFWKVSDWDQELREKHKVSLEILELANSMKVDFAFPTRTLHLFNENHSSSNK